MNYQAYQKPRDLVWRVLVQEGVTELPVRVGELCGRMSIRVQLYEPKDGNDGFSAIVDGEANQIPVKIQISVTQTANPSEELPKRLVFFFSFSVSSLAFFWVMKRED